MDKRDHIEGKELILSLILLGILLGCGSSRSYKNKYENAWREVVESDAWQVALEEQKDPDHYLVAMGDSGLWYNEDIAISGADEMFNAKYNSWISRAYFKIIAEAEEADVRIRSEYERFMAENPLELSSSDQNAVRIIDLYQKKYKAHNTMLEGLKSWRSFEEFGSDDLEFFKRENLQTVRNMYKNGLPDEKIISYLVYRLADLYHTNPE